MSASRTSSPTRVTSPSTIPISRKCSSARTAAIVSGRTSPTDRREGRSPPLLPLLEVDRGAAVDEAAVEAERREDRIGNVDLVRRIEAPASRGRPWAERGAVRIGIEDVVRTDRELDAGPTLQPDFKIGHPLGAEEDI